MKNFLRAVVIGAGTYVGYLLVKGIHSICVDPYKKAKLKNKMNKIKSAIKE